MYNKRKIIFDSNKVILNTKPTSKISDAYRRIKVNIDNNNKNNAKVFMITSALKNEGKTLSLMNLATCFSEDKTKKVVVVDLNLRNPSLHSYFNVNNEFGVVDMVNGKELKIINNKELNLDLVVSGSETIYPTTTLENNKVKELINSLKDKYDYVFVDSPSILECPDALVISQYVDETLFVISKIVSNKKDSLLALKELKNNNVKVFGTIYNDVK